MRPSGIRLRNATVNHRKGKAPHSGKMTRNAFAKHALFIAAGIRSIDVRSSPERVPRARQNNSNVFCACQETFVFQERISFRFVGN